jgi:hypothetical protein
MGRLCRCMAQQVCGNIHTNDLRREALCQRPRKAPPSPSEIKHPLPGGKDLRTRQSAGATSREAESGYEMRGDRMSPVASSAVRLNSARTFSNPRIKIVGDTAPNFPRYGRGSAFASIA